MQLHFVTLASCTTAAVLTANDLLPMLSAQVEGQLDFLSKQINRDQPANAPSFRQEVSQPRLWLRSELNGFLQELYDAEKEKEGKDLDLAQVFEDTVKTYSPRFRNLLADSESRRDPMNFELDADAVKRLFDESLTAAVAPLYKLLVVSESSPVKISCKYSPLEPKVIILSCSSCKISVPYIVTRHLHAYRQLTSGAQHIVNDCSDSESVKGEGDGPSEGMKITLGLGDLVIYADVEKLVEHREALLEYGSKLHAHIGKAGPFIESLMRYTDLQKDVVPLYNDLLPRSQHMTFRTIAALSELSPNRINPVTLIPASLELLAVSTSLRATIETTMPLGGIVLSETYYVLTNFTEYLPALEEILGDTEDILPIIGQVDPQYQNLTDNLAMFLNRTQAVLPELEKLLPVFVRTAPSLREFLRVAFDFSSDLSKSLDEIMAKIARDAPKMLDLYDDADDFIPLIAGNVISVLRRGGIPARLPYLRNYIPELSDLMPAVIDFLKNTNETLPELLDSMIPLAASIPRHNGVLETTSDTLVHMSVVGSQLSESLTGTAISTIENAGPFMEALNAPVVNVFVALPLVMSLMSTAMEALPRVAAALPSISPTMRSMYRLTSYMAPAGSVVKDVVNVVQQMPDPAGNLTTAGQQAASPRASKSPLTIFFDALPLLKDAFSKN